MFGHLRQGKLAYQLIPDNNHSMTEPSSSDLRRHAESILDIPRELHNYQWEGVSFLYRSTTALLADEMGLGKTVQTSVALALLMYARKDIRRALIVVPSSLIMNWISELAMWAPSLTVRRVQGNLHERETSYMLPIPVLVSSYEQIRQDGLDRIPSDCFDIVILDEAQRIKNRHSTTALACQLLPRKYAWALSATPLENSIEDVISILGFLDPSVSSDLPANQLPNKLETMMLRRRKTEVRKELPPVIIQDLKLELTLPQRKRYDEIWENRAKAVETDRQDAGVVLLGLLTRLKIICNLDINTGASSKLNALREICDGVEDGGRILVFSQFVETLEWISARISLPSDFLTGKMPINARQSSIDRFKQEPAPRLLFISLRAGGTGLNLEEASQVVIFDRWWNPAVEMQAIHRAHRFSREKPLHVVRFLMSDTIEEHIASILESKESLFEDVVESPETRTRDFTIQEMMRILDLSGKDIFIPQCETKE